jgi:hypothetical protein
MEDHYATTDRPIASGRIADENTGIAIRDELICLQPGVMSALVAGWPAAVPGRNRQGNPSRVTRGGLLPEQDIKQWVLGRVRTAPPFDFAVPPNWARLWPQLSSRVLIVS